MRVWQADGELQFDGKLDFDGKLYLLIQYIVAGSVRGTDEVRARRYQYPKQYLPRFFSFLY